MVDIENGKSQLITTTPKPVVPQEPDNLFLYLHNFSIPRRPDPDVTGPCLARLSKIINPFFTKYNLRELTVMIL